MPPGTEIFSKERIVEVSPLSGTAKKRRLNDMDRGTGLDPSVSTFGSDVNIVGLEASTQYLKRNKRSNKDNRKKVESSMSLSSVSLNESSGFAMTPLNHHTSSNRVSLTSKSIKEDDEMAITEKAAGGATNAPEAYHAGKKASLLNHVAEDAEIAAIHASIPRVELPPTSLDENEHSEKSTRNSHLRYKKMISSEPLEIPVGKENCLAGLSFVFTGVLDLLSREDGLELIKRYGGKVTLAPSKRTDYVILGADAGPKKLETIRTNSIKTIREEGLFKLIRCLPAHGGDSSAAIENKRKVQHENMQIMKMAAQMEKDFKVFDPRKQPCGQQSLNSFQMKPQPDNRLWTSKYAPTQISQICGNKGQIEKLQTWLRNFPKNQRTGFKLAGKDGSGIYRAVMIHGPPGIGKTTTAHLLAQSEGYDIIETNASDTRSKKLVESGLKGVLSTNSIQGYISSDGQETKSSMKKLVLILDEVDGMSAGDRGGAGALATVCKRTSIPIILICNDRKLPKMKPFDYITYDLPFRRPTADQIRSRIMTIAYREGLKIPANVVNALIEGSGADIRQIINMISTAKLDQGNLDFSSGKQMSRAWEKHIILKPWDITGKILGPAMFARSGKASLNDKVELYFNDHEFSYLMLQENYLGTSPSLASQFTGIRRSHEILSLIDQAAESISDGDLVDTMIHGSQQHWTLMPTHAIFSFVRPASLVYGNLAGHQTRFTQWLGKNSNQGRAR